MINRRIEWIDLTRFLAILCVIVCHCIGVMYKYNADFMSHLSLSSQIFACSLLSIGRFGVPFFLMITGYLLLDRVYDSEKTSRFWSKNVKHLIICTIIWAIISELFLIFIMHNPISLQDFIVSIFLLKPLSLNHFWYMPMIIGMYILIPFVANALKEYDTKTILKPLIFFAVLVYLAPFLISLVKFYGIKGLSVQISLGFSGGVYGIYMVLGYLIKKDFLKKITSLIVALILIITFIVYIFIEIFYFNHGFTIHIYYESPFVLICSICLFELISRLKKVKFYATVYTLSKYSFGVFLVHNLYVRLFTHFFTKLNMNNSIKFIVLFLVVVILSYITVILISRIPKAGKYILYLK